MKLMTRLTLWDLKRDIKHYEEKIKLIKQVIKHIENENEKIKQS